MEPIFALLAGILTASAVYLLLSRHMLSIIVGVTLLGSAANIIVFAEGRLTLDAAPFVPEGALEPAAAVANPLPQALVLTAIVIGFGLAAFALSLSVAARYRLGTVDPDEMTGAEAPSKK